VYEKLTEVIELHNKIGGFLLEEMQNLIASKQDKKKQCKDLHLPSSTISPIERQINKRYSSIELSTNIDKNSIHLYAYMDYWYGALYSLIEGYLKLGYIHNGVELLLDSDPSLLTSLKGYRHATFHYAKTYHNFPLKDGLLIEQKSVKWLNNLHNAFNDYVIKELLKPDIQCYIIKYLENTQ